MSDEEDSMSEGFSASEDEWKPTKTVKGGESSDDDDSDFEESPIAAAGGGGTASGASSTGASKKRGEPKARSATKQTASKKRTGLSLRAKLYNKYRPPPKTFSPPSSGAMGKNSPSSSTSRTNSKNATAPNESIRHKNNRGGGGDDDNDDGNATDTSSGSSIDNYLVRYEDLDIQSSFFNVEARPAKKPSVSPVPVFDCNAGLGNLTDSESDNKEEVQAYDFKHLLDYANNLEKVKENLKQASEEAASDAKKKSSNIDNLDVYAVLALGEKMQNRSHNDGEDEDDEDDGGGGDKIDHHSSKAPPSKLNKTKSTRIKRHTKTRPTSTVAADDTDDSDWEEVADGIDTNASSSSDITEIGNLEIFVELPSKHRDKKTKTQQDLEMALKRKLNRDIKERQILLHKASLLCHFGRTYFYNRLLNDTGLMQKALKLLPSSNAYPPERGTEIKYYQSLVTWFKSAIKLMSPNLYPQKTAAKPTKAKAHKVLLKQIEKREARSKQDMIFLFVILLRGMGLQCRLIANMQPMPLKPAQSDLLTIKMKKDDDSKDKNSSSLTSKKVEHDSDMDQKPSTSASSRSKILKQNSKDTEHKTKDNNTKDKHSVTYSDTDQKSRNAAAKQNNKDKNPKIEEHKKNVSKKPHKKESNDSDMDQQPTTSASSRSKLTKQNSKDKEHKTIDPKKKNKHSETYSDIDQKPSTSASSRSKPDKKESNEKLDGNIKSTKRGDISEIKSSQICKENIKTRRDEKKTAEDRSKSFEEMLQSRSKVVKSTQKEEMKNCPRVVKETKKITQSCNESQTTAKDTEKSQSKTIKTHKKEETHEKEEKLSKTVKCTTSENKVPTSKHEIEKLKIIDAAESSTTLENTVATVRERTRMQDTNDENLLQMETKSEDLANSQKENAVQALKKPTLARLKRTKATDHKNSDEEIPKKKPTIEAGSPVIPKIVVQGGNNINAKEQQLPTTSKRTRSRSRSKSPQAHISTAFLLKGQQYKEKFPGIIKQNTNVQTKSTRAKSPLIKISTDFLKHPPAIETKKRILRSRQKPNETAPEDDSNHTQIPQLDGADDGHEDEVAKSKRSKTKRPNIKKLKVQHSTENSDDDFEPSPSKKPKTAPTKTKPDRRVLTTDDDEDSKAESPERAKRKETAGDLWVEVWSDVEEQWVCVDLFKGKIHCVDTIRKSASPNLSYIFAFQNDLSIKDVTARYSPHWTTVVRKARVEKAWLDTAITNYLGHRTKRDIKEDQELRAIHEQKPMPTAIGDYKNHPFYALERHLLKFEALYPPEAPPLGYIRKEAVYSRDCVHNLHSREIWLKQARTVKLGEKPYKIVKARPKWDRITQTVIKDQPLEIFGYWQTQDYDPPTAENGLVPRNAYGNVELFKACMLPKKTVHLRLPGLNRICKKLNVDCANAVVGFDFHQGACHPTYDGFIVCEEFQDQVVAAWHQDQEEQELKQQEKYEARVYGNWKKLIRGLLIREYLKKKYNYDNI